MVLVVLCALPFMWYLVVNGSAGVLVAGLLLAFLVLWFVMCLQQMRGHVREHARDDGPASGGPAA